MVGACYVGMLIVRLSHSMFGGFEICFRILSLSSASMEKTGLPCDEL